MKSNFILAFGSVFTVLTAFAWAPVRIAGLTNDVPPTLTRWGANVTPENALREYPRPQMARGNWSNLNGLWQYAVTSRKDEEVAQW